MSRAPVELRIVAAARPRSLAGEIVGRAAHDDVAALDRLERFAVELAEANGLSVADSCALIVGAVVARHDAAAAEVDS